MMLLRELLQGTGIPVGPACANHPVGCISCDSREGMPNGLFVALPGFKVNGADFIRDAVRQGARTIVKQQAGRVLGDYTIPDDVCVLDTADTKAFLRCVTPRFYGHPGGQVKTIGVTGTNGKTTITYLLESILRAAGHKCGVVGTINARIGTTFFPSKNTTPGYLDNQRYLARLVQEGVPYCVMEASSHALDQGRLDGIDFAAAVFTNLTQDHLDYHKDMADYFRAKSLLFFGLSPQAAVLINADDGYGQRLKTLTRARVWTYAIDAPADVRATQIRYSLGGTEFDVHFSGGKISVPTRMIGRHNVYNILAAFVCALAQGFAVETIIKGIEGLKNVPGRLEPVDRGQDFFVFIDYAHTEDGLINVLRALKAVTAKGVIVVFGCGGDRDHGKRPRMGHVACLLADHAVVTSDNPRSEDPQAIIDQIVAGFTRTNFETCVDRRQAIGRALKMAKTGDVVLIAGKGHEERQIFKDKTVPFNEREIVMEFLKCSPSEKL
ncbi:MAG: UDP-N-acetylmuramoyl-L-alanyl-D-glutamate--2,6-diaminopimelate ligase [Candidatus Omnitrophica bacterium]|nr:UDP-N-acetylmuramoyl-L-alanyl-D-glutamate--2,6-diaminopimelate ligase [Candidatus Omnitrophota bacterium]